MADDTPPIKTVAGVLAGGSTIVTGVLTFLGIKDDSLDRILRAEPRAALLFAGLIACGLTCGLVAQQIVFTGTVRVMVVAACAVLLVVAFHFVANNVRATQIPGGAHLRTLVLIVVGLAVLAIVLFGPLRLSINAALLVVGAVLFALGTYGAVRLAIDAKSLAGAPQLGSPHLEREADGLLHLKATVSADSLLDCQSLKVTAEKTVLGVQPGGSDGKATIAVDTVLTPEMVADGIVELTAQLDPRAGTKDCTARAAAIEKLHPAVTTSRLSTLARLPAPALSASWTDATTLKVSVKAIDDAGPASAAVVAVGRDAKGGCTVLTYSQLPVSTAGDLDVELPVVVTAAISQVSVRTVYLDTPPSAVPDLTACDAAPTDIVSTVVLNRPSAGASTTTTTTSHGS